MVNTPRPNELSVSEHAVSGPPLHPLEVVDRISRLYAYTLQWMDNWLVERPAFGKRVPGLPPRIGRWIGLQAKSYPYVFSTWLEYPEVFDEIDSEALATFLSRMPYTLGPTKVDEAVRAITGINFPGFGQQGLKPRSRWQILELPGSAGRYTSLMCQVYRELNVTQNCTVVCQDWQRNAEGLIERTAAGVYALIAGAGEGSRPRIIDGLPDLESEYDMIVGFRGALTEDEDRIRRMLTSDGKLVLMDKDKAGTHLTPVR